MFKKFFQLDNVNVDLHSQKIKFPNSLRKKVQSIVYEMLKPTYFEHIPLGKILEALKQHGVIALQEDGTEWSGFLVGGAECGSKEAESQHAVLPLAIKPEDENGMSTEGYKSVNSSLYLSWCKMPSGKYEVIGYIS